MKTIRERARGICINVDCEPCSIDRCARTTNAERVLRELVEEIAAHIEGCTAHLTPKLKGESETEYLDRLGSEMPALFAKVIRRFLGPPSAEEIIAKSLNHLQCARDPLATRCDALSVAKDLRAAGLLREEGR